MRLLSHFRQNLPLIADLDLYCASLEADDPLAQLLLWVDEWRLSAARGMVEELAPLLPKKLEGHLSLAWIALEMAANPENSLLKGHPKACWHYFEDFVGYLRAAACEGESDFAKAFCTAFYTAKGESTSLNQLIETHGGETLAAHLRLEYNALRDILQNHSHGPLFQLIDLLHQMPQELAASYFGDNEVHLLRLPSFTVQEIIDPTYQLFHSQGRHLLMNLQGRHLLLEQLGAYSLAFDTDFYHQRSVYEHNNDSNKFFEHFFGEVESSYILPKILFNFLEELLEEIHIVFFEGRRELTLSERKACIDLTHFFIILKLIEMESPDYLAFVDQSGGAAGVFLGCLAILRGEVVGSEREEALHQALFFVPLILGDRMERLLTLLELMEDKAAKRCQLQEAFRSLFTDRVI